MSAVGVSTPSRSNRTAAKRNRRRRGIAPELYDAVDVHRVRACDQLWGRQTELAIGNFPIAHRPLDVRVAHALAAIKRHAAVVNASLGVPGVDADVATAIGDAARRIEAGELDDQFPIDVYQTGSGTSTNMNVNEVVATLGRPCARSRRAPERSRQRVAVVERHRAVGDPHRRRPPARRRRAPGGRGARRGAARHGGAVRRRRQGRADAPHGRHAGDARAGGRRVGRPARRRAGAGRAPTSPCSASCRSAGRPSAPASTPRPSSPPAVIAALAAETGLPLRPSANPMVQQGGQGALAEASSGLRGIAVALTKIANDIRLLASGPSAGLAELLLPELQAGSSIMPGKVNPVLCESVNQVAARVFGNDAHRRLRRLAGDPRAEHVPAGDGRRAVRVGHAAGQRVPAVRRALRRRHRGRRGALPRATPSGRRRSPPRSTRSSATPGRPRSSTAPTTSAARSSTSSSTTGVLAADEARQVLDPLRLTHPST